MRPTVKSIIQALKPGEEYFVGHVWGNDASYWYRVSRDVGIPISTRFVGNNLYVRLRA